MNDSLTDVIGGFINPSYAKQASNARKSREKALKSLLSMRKLPITGWDDLSITMLLKELAAMDSNNFVGNVGVGEREGRVYSSLVQSLHMNLAHGIGRSGDVAAVQPKAAGSSLLLQLTQCMVLHALQLTGIMDAKACLILPVATGMAHVLTLLTLRAKHPDKKYVIWPRIDQKTCLKAITSAGLTPIVVDNLLEGDEARTDMKAIEAHIARIGAENVLCILSTTSCFAPRAPDRVIDIAKVAKTHDIAHVINNAYGLQTANATDLITKAQRRGRVDIVIQSTDKNFMVPVGGSVVVGFSQQIIDDIAKTYPGRAAMTPIRDLFITLLAMGQEGWLTLLKQRMELLPYFSSALTTVATKHGERLLKTPNNEISMGVTLTRFERGNNNNNNNNTDSKLPDKCSYIGSMLFSRNISGARTIPQRVSKTIQNIEFTGYGASISDYPVPYITFACAIGMNKADVDIMVAKFDKTLTDAAKKYKISKPE